MQMVVSHDASLLRHRAKRRGDVIPQAEAVEFVVVECRGRLGN
jgi:hypothetical protein